MKKRMLAALLAGSMLLTACGGTGGQTASQAPKGEASQSAPADTGTQSGQKVTMKVSVGVADNHFEAVAVNKLNIVALPDADSRPQVTTIDSPDRRACPWRK
jgi:ABC-type glycerol-3-phosphate transport system substrate-binding protein